MLRPVFTRRWLTALAVATVFAVAAYYLGVWQYGKYQAKVARNDVIASHVTAAPVRVADVLPGAEGLTKAQAFTRVKETGTYADLPQLLVRNRVKGSAAGYEVLAPFTMSDGRTIAVDRGWVPPSNAGSAREPDVPPVPTGQVTVVGWLQQGEGSDHDRLRTGQLASLDLGEASSPVARPLLGAYLNCEGETLGRGYLPALDRSLWTRPDSGLEGQPLPTPTSGGCSPSAGSSRRLPRGPARPARREPSRERWLPSRRKCRIWDDEDE